MLTTKEESMSNKADEKSPAIEPLIDAQSAAKLLGLHPVTLREMAKQKRIPGLQIGRAWRFRVSSLNTWIAAQEYGA